MTSNSMRLDRGIPVKLNTFKGTIFGGPFRNYTPCQRRLVAIKMAVEIDHPHDYSIPTPDFSVPDVLSMQKGLVYCLSEMRDGNDTYVGCMGGVGRTGLFMGCMVKVMNDYREAHGQSPLGDPVTYVRSQYHKHAIETEEQKAFVRTFDSKPVLQRLSEMEAVPVMYVTKYPRFIQGLIDFFKNFT